MTTIDRSMLCNRGQCALARRSIQYRYWLGGHRRPVVDQTLRDALTGSPPGQLGLVIESSSDEVQNAGTHVRLIVDADSP
jgi:hypothetical protein